MNLISPVILNVGNKKIILIQVANKNFDLAAFKFIARRFACQNNFCSFFLY